MVRITTGQGVFGPGAVRPRGRSGGKAGFTLDDSEETTTTSETKGFTPIGSLDAVLALQEVDPDQQRRKQAVDHGRDLLDQLEQLKLDLLSGRVDPDRLSHLAAQLSRNADHSDDPKLRQLLNDIELRAHVELAKLGR